MKSLAVFMLFFLALFALVVSIEAYSVGAEDHEEEIYKIAHYNLKSGDDLSLQVAEEGASSEVETVEAEYTGVPGVVGADRQWVEVGTWTTSADITGNFEVNGSITFNLWVAEVQNDFSSNADFEFTISVDGTQLAQATTTFFTSTSVEEVTATTGAVQFNVTDDTEISVHIRYRGWNDIYVYYDSYDMDSGFRVSMNPIRILSYKTGTNSASVKFADRFGVDWFQSAYCSRIFSNGSEMEADYSVVARDSIVDGNDTIPVYEISWSGIENNESFPLNISLSYTRIREPVNETTWYLSGSGGDGDDDDDDDGIFGGSEEEDITILGGLGLIIIISVVLITWKKKRATKDEFPEEDFAVEEEEYDDPSEEEE